jgi:aminopeptidase N
MTRIRAILGLVLALGLFASLAANAADDNAKKKKKDANTTFGTVTAVTADKDNADTGTITIKPGAGGKGVKGGANAAANAADNEKKFTYTKDTTFEKIAGKKKKDTATAKDCTDQRVIITSADGKKADKVTILPMMKKDNNQ